MIFCSKPITVGHQILMHKRLVRRRIGRPSPCGMVTACFFGPGPNRLYRGNDFEEDEKRKLADAGYVGLCRHQFSLPRPRNIYPLEVTPPLRNTPPVIIQWRASRFPWGEFLYALPPRAVQTCDSKRFQVGIVIARSALCQCFRIWTTFYRKFSVTRPVFSLYNARHDRRTAGGCELGRGR